MLGAWLQKAEGGRMDPLVIAALMAAWVLVALLLVLLFVAARQHGRALLQLEEVQNSLVQIEEQLADIATGLVALRASTLNSRIGHDHAAPSLPEGLPLNASAPDFSLPDVQGQVHTLRDFAGTQSLIVFFSVGCGYCQQMAPRLGQIRTGGPRVLVIGEGPADAYRHFADEHQWQCEVLLDEGGTVAQAYMASGTPTGYLLDAEGRIASSLAIGADALLRLLPTAPAQPPAPPDSYIVPDRESDALRNGHHKLQDAIRNDQPSEPAALATSATLVADGLRPGVFAPAFVLPDPQGTQHALADFYGKQLLLVFVDPACEGSRTLAARLGSVRSADSPANRPLVFVSRGRTDENQLWRDQYALAGPVLLQQGWEVASSYGAFATPAAYLLDEQGRISSGLSVGPDGVLELAQQGHIA